MSDWYDNEYRMYNVETDYGFRVYRMHVQNGVTHRLDTLENGAQHWVAVLEPDELVPARETTGA